MLEDKSNKVSRKAYVFAGLGLSILVFAILMNYSNPKFDIVDIYTDSTAGNKFIFLFVETKSDSKDELMKWAKNIKASDNLLDMPYKTDLSILTVYFYSPEDTIKLNEELESSLKEKYSDKYDFTHKLNYDPKGWQYIGHTDASINDMPSDSVFRTHIFVPKMGYRASEFLKQIKD